MAKSKRPERLLAEPPVQGRSKEEEPKFRLRPRSPRTAGRGDIGWSVALRSVFRYAKNSSRSRTGGSTRSGVYTQSRRVYNQRCAVRATYSQNRTAGQWRAHGIYIARESAAGKEGRQGFGHDEELNDVPSTLDRWQRSGDERIWKVILSPEFGDRIDLEKMTREVMRRSETQLGTKLEWFAVSHFNTEHPHVHLVIRGRREDGTPLNLPREFIKREMRSLAENACTLQLGPRTELDAQEAAEREINQRRYTSLDRAIERRAIPGEQDNSKHSQVSINRELMSRSSTAAFHERTLHSRLVVLQKMGLADQLNDTGWRVRADLSAVLRTMQLVSDRQKLLASNGVLLSDDRLRLNVLDFRKTPEVQGRVLVHGEEEQSNGAGRRYLLLEGTDAQVHMIFYAPEMEDARSRGKLKPNSFVRLQKKFVAGQGSVGIEDYGSADLVLKNQALIGRTARDLLMRGIIPNEEGWGGWLGRYQAEVRRAASEPRNRSKSHTSER